MPPQDAPMAKVEASSDPVKALLELMDKYGIDRAMIGVATSEESPRVEDSQRALREHPKARALSDLAEEGGAWTVALLRLAPILPFTPTNAVLGLTGMRLRDLALGTFLGMAPGALLYAWAGSLVPSAEALEEGESLVPGPLVWGLLAASIVAAVVIGIAAARRLRRATPEGRPPR